MPGSGLEIAHTELGTQPLARSPARPPARARAHMAAALVTTRRFPPPWSVDEYNDACFIVRDHDGQQLAYIYFEDEPGRRSAAKLLSKDEARRIAVNIRRGWQQ